MPIPLSAIVPLVQTQNLQLPFDVDGRLVVQSAQQRFKRSTGELVFEGEVRAQYGVTTLHADRLTLNIKDRQITQGHAEGSVRIVDPEAEFEGRDFKFDWVSGEGTGYAVVVRLGEVTAHAETIQISRAAWTLLKVRIVPCSHEPLLAFTASSLTVEPSRQAIAKQFAVSLQGFKFVQLPSYRQSLRPQTQSSNLPKLSFRGDNKIGISWDYGQQIAPNLTVDASVDAFSNRQASGEVVLTRSFVRNLNKAASPRPRSDFAEPFTFGFFEDVGVSNWERERTYLASERNGISLASTWNVSRQGLGQERISKPIEAIYDRSGELGLGWSAWGQVRWQQLDPGSMPSENRTVFQGALLPPAVALSNQVQLTSRIDFRSQEGSISDSSWIRGQIGAIYRPTPQIGIGIAYSERSQTGTTLYAFDQPIVDARWHVRADLDFGATQFSFLAKYSGGPLGWFDHEYKVSQVMGCYEPFAIWKEKPRSFSFGLVFRPLREFDARSKRMTDRSPANLPQTPKRPNQKAGPIERIDGD